MPGHVPQPAGRELSSLSCFSFFPGREHCWKEREATSWNISRRAWSFPAGRENSPPRSGLWKCKQPKRVGGVRPPWDPLIFGS